MENYDYKCGKKRVEEILDNDLAVLDQDKLPSINELTFDNGYYCWVTAIFVDLRDSTSLFTNEDKVKVSKIIRSFTSEIIEILRVSDNLREIGVRGDCVYAIYTTPTMPNEMDCFNQACNVNTYMKMLNLLLSEKDYSKISAGIGVATAKELIIKAGRKGVGINNTVWIGAAVTTASKLSSITNKGACSSMAISELSYYYIIEKLVEESPEARAWFKEYSDKIIGKYYCCNLTMDDFNKWINDGMTE